MANANSESGRETKHRVHFENKDDNNSEKGNESTEDEGNETAGAAMHSFQWPDIAFLAQATMMEGAAEDKEKDGDKSTKYDEPKTFQEAWHHPDEFQRNKWREAIRKEFRDMIKRGVWRVMKRRDMPNGRKTIKCKWVFKVKRNGIFRARLVACGYSQIPGVDYTEHFSPVINDITWRIMLVAMIMWKLDAWLIDVETAFLHGEFEEGEEVFMDIPMGLYEVEGNVDANEDCLYLLKTTYGLTQASRAYFRFSTTILKDIGFEGGDADPCMLHWKSKYGMVYIGLYVDDCLCIGQTEALELLEEEMIKRKLTLKTDKTLKDYLSCEINFNEDKTKAVLRQPHLIKTLEEDFGEMVKGMANYRTPGTPGKGLIRGNATVDVSKEKHKVYRSGTGKLLYLVKHTRPDIANAVRELSKMLDATTELAFKEMKRLIKYVLDTKEYGLKIEPKIGSKENMWQVIGYSDSDFAGDRETRKSVGGFIIYLCGVPISWRSKSQQTISLSSTEAEWIALSETAKEVLFIAQILKSMGVEIEYPMTIYVDNLAAIFMANNVTTSQRTRHVDIRTKFVTHFRENGILKIILVKGVDNESDIMTKNVKGELHDKHVPKLMTTTDEEIAK